MCLGCLVALKTAHNYHVWVGTTSTSLKANPRALRKNPHNNYHVWVGTTSTSLKANPRALPEAGYSKKKKKRLKPSGNILKTLQPKKKGEFSGKKKNLIFSYFCSKHS